MMCHLFWCKVVISNDTSFAFLGIYIFTAVDVVHLINKEAIRPNPGAVEHVCRRGDSKETHRHPRVAAGWGVPKPLPYVYVLCQQEQPNVP